jgi:carboxyl-terminal processing protease
MKRLLAILLALTLSLGATAQSTATETQPKADPSQQLQKLVQFYRYLVGFYIDEVDSGKLVEDAIVKVLSELDPHSTYIDAEEMTGVREDFDGSFSGIGVEFRVMDDTVRIVNTIAGGPSADVGILPNDIIVKVNGESIVGVKQTEVPKLLRGKEGTKVDIEVARHGVAEPLGFTIVRRQIPINSVDAAYMITPQTAYIKVNRFARKTMDEFVEAMDKMPNAKQVILDLRSNSGGLIEPSIEMAGYFLPKDREVVSTEGRVIPKESYKARKGGVFTRGEVIVLIDEFSASASEIVSGALQDWDRATIIGRPSFGKGLVQRQIPMVDGSAVRLTVARYHTPTGRVIQRPFENGKREEYYANLTKRLSEELPLDSATLDSLPKYRTLIKGRTVYGGGGIMPDIIVKSDTSDYSDYWAELSRRGILAEFVVDYLDMHRSELESQFSTDDQFVEEFEVGDEMIESLVVFAEGRGIARNDEELAISRRSIAEITKALIAQRLWDSTAYFKVVNRTNNIVKRALETLSVK